MGWEDIKEMQTINLREELLTLHDKEVEYAALLPPRRNATGEDDGSSFDEIRRNICQWNYECVDYFLFDRDLVYLSMHYFDRYLAAQQEQTAREERNAMPQPPSVVLNHLLALSSLYLACKLHSVSTESLPLPESSPRPSTPAADNSSTLPKAAKPRIRLQDFCNMSRGTYCPEMIEEMELAIVTNLGWRLHPPTPTDFLIRFAKILSILLDDSPYGSQGWSVFEVSKYQIELAVYGPELCKKFPPSKVALAAILNAMDSKVVKTKRAIVPSHIRRSFLQRLEYLGGGFSQMNVEGEDIVQIRSTLKKLCSKTITLPGQLVEATQSRDFEFTPISDEAKSFEFELSEVRSPVSVATDRF
mmetsp:Transcript_1731/g.4351  ORF Transcript_1731/g.4351 Transcript_1731/m.4351 type:complete len:359 (-) Transcript_1731:435-1511(-)